MNKQTRVVYSLLGAVWVLMIAWQLVEHLRVNQAAKAALINRARDISTTVGIVLRSQRHLITKERLESALHSLLKPEELNAVAMLNAAGEIVASAGTPIDLNMAGLVPTGEHWGDRTVALMNLVDLGTNVTLEADGPRPTIVVPRSELFNRSGTNRPPPDIGPPPPPGIFRQPPSVRPASEDDRSLPPANSGTNGSLAEGTGPPRPRGDREGRSPFNRPFWMSETEWKSTIAKKGVHSFVVVMSNQTMRATSNHDLWLRCLITALASVSVAGLALAWSNLVRSGELELRLVRAAELNARLREMSVAAAGLAHETKNPLNIIRGVAQMISKQPDAPAEIRQKTRGIVEEADRVTAQVNEFINFSRPRQLRPVAVALSSAVAEVVRALGPDIDEKSIRVTVQEGLPAIEADEQQLRQALFNLLINAIQALEPGGAIEIAGQRKNSHGAALEIRDNGPGVPEDHRTDVFKPLHNESKGYGVGTRCCAADRAGAWLGDRVPGESAPRRRVPHLPLAPR